jgi:4-alpha-glucanotransferase
MRQSGILMHITSLPGPYGVGTMGAHAFGFVDFLAEAGQHCWQILPLNPTGFGDSPYQSCSTFAGNPYLIDLELLVEEGLLQREELESVRWCSREDKVDYGLLYNNRMAVLRKAYLRHGDTEAFARFRAENDAWLPDFVAYMGLKDKFGGKPWYQWPEDVKHYSPKALEAAWEYLGYEGI